MTKSKFLKIKKNSQKFKFQNFRNLTSAIDAQWFEVPLTRIPGESVDKQKNYREDWEESEEEGGGENPLYEVARHLKTYAGVRCACMPNFKPKHTVVLEA